MVRLLAFVLLVGCAGPSTRATRPRVAPLPVAVAPESPKAPPWTPARALRQATLDPLVPCRLTLDVAREPSPTELLAVLLPDLDVEAERLPDLADPFPSWTAHLCVGRPLVSLTPITTVGVSEVPIPAFEEVTLPAGPVVLAAYRASLGDLALQVIVAREGREVRILAVTDEHFLAVQPMAFVRVGRLEGVLRERPWGTAFRGHSVRHLEFLPVGEGGDRGLHAGADWSMNVDMGAVLVRAEFHEALWRDGWRPPWTATLRSRVFLEKDGLRVEESWTFVHGATHRTHARRVTRRYRASELGGLVESPSFDEFSAWPEVTEGLPR
jgi:hypothetical protein